MDAWLPALYAALTINILTVTSINGTYGECLQYRNSGIQPYSSPTTETLKVKCLSVRSEGSNDSFLDTRSLLRDVLPPVSLRQAPLSVTAVLPYKPSPQT